MAMLTNKERAWAYEMWCVGYTLDQIAEALGVCHKTVERSFKQHGLVRIRPVLNLPEGFYDE